MVGRMLRKWADEASRLRKAVEELPQACSAKLSRQIRLPDEEEEIGEFIVVDTGTLYHPEVKSQYTMTEDEVNTVSTSRTTPIPSIILVEEEKPFIKSSTEPLSTDAEVVEPAKNDVLALPAEPPETTDGITSRSPSVEPHENVMLSGTQHDPIILSPLSIIDEETSHYQKDSILLDKMHSSESLLLPVVQNDEMLPHVPQEMEIDSPSLLLPIVAQERSTSAALKQPCDSTTSESVIPGDIQREEPIPIDISASESFGDAPVGVLVRTRDRFPSKFVVSGMSPKPEVGHQVPTQTVSSVQYGSPWIETVTGVVYNNFSAGTGSESLQSAESMSIMDSSPTTSTMMPFPCEQRCCNLLGIIGALDPQYSCHRPSLSNESQTPIQQCRNCGSVSKEVAQASPNILHISQGQTPTDQKRQASPTEANDVHDLGSALERIPSPVQYPSRFQEETTSSRPNPLDSVSIKLPKDLMTKAGFSFDILRSDHSVKSASSVDSDITVSTKRTSSPTLRFISDNRAESNLTTVEVQDKIQIFVKDAVAILPGEQPTLPRTYPAGIILWQSLQKFHKWYAREVKLETGSKARSAQTITMKFDLLDVHWQPENVFYLPRKATLDEFRDLKQCIWDLFWVSATLVGEESPKPFRIRIAPAANVVDGTKLGHLTIACPPTSIITPVSLAQPPSSQSSFDNMVRNFQDLAPNNAQRYHRHRGSRPSSLRLDSPPVLLDVGGVKTPKLLLDHLQQNANRESSQPLSIKSSPTRPESHGSSTASTRGIELLHPPLERPKSMMITNFQPHQSPQFLNMPPFTNIDPPRALPPPRIFETAKVTSSIFQPDSISFQSSHPNRTLQLPTPRPSPAIKDPYPMTTLQKQPTAADNNYAANTARPMFSVKPHKAITTSRTTLPSAQQTRVPNTSQPAPEIPAMPTAIAPRLSQDGGKEPQAENSTPGFQTSRTPREQKRFRDNALRMLSDRPTLVLDPNERTGGRRRTYPEISGVIVDKNSEMGLVQITERGSILQQVNTGQDVYLDQYTELTMREGQVCIIHGSSTVFYYREGTRDAWSNQVEGQRKLLPNQAPGKQPMRQQTKETSVSAQPRCALPTMPKTQAPSLQGQREQVTVPPPPAAEIKVRLQKDAAGHFTAPHDFAFFATITTMELLFDWFSRRTGHGGPFGPERLRVTLKDAMPVAKYYDLERGYGGAEFANAELQRMKEDIMNEYEKTKAFMPDLKEFAVLVVDPFWVEGERNDIRRSEYA